MENKNTNFDVLELLAFENETQTTIATETLPQVQNEDILGDIETSVVFSSQEPDALETALNSFQEVQQEQFPTDVLENIEKVPEPQVHTQTQTSFGAKIVGWVVFIIKYISTSTVIFLLLLSASNYSAYIEIARSYLNPEVLEQNKNALMTSVNGTQLLDESLSGSQTETTTQKISTVKNKTYHSMDKLLNGTYDEDLNMQIEITPYENRVIIPKIGKNIPLLDVKNKTVQNVKELEDVFMNELTNGIIRYPGSAKPGEEGNSFIFGHSSNFPWIKWDYNDVFALLDNVVFGDEIIVYYNQKKYVYKIREKNIIKPGDVSVLKRNNGKSEISLMTCWPVGTTLNRMIVVWELVKE